MTDRPFDCLARFLSGTTSRCQTLAALGALAAARRQSTQAATQLDVAICGAAGAVCTPLKGCCAGLVCATSHINPNYGVCIPGEGEHLAVTTRLVVPASAGVVEQLAALALTEEDGVAAAEVLEARQTAKDTRRSRKDTHRAKKRSRQTSDTSLTADPNDSDDLTDPDEDETGTE
jgi:hypothetical protein